jgi:hypothetical protein
MYIQGISKRICAKMAVGSEKATIIRKQLIIKTHI